MALIEGPATDAMNWFISSDRQSEIGALFPGLGIVFAVRSRRIIAATNIRTAPPRPAIQRWPAVNAPSGQVFMLVALPARRDSPC